MSAHFSDGLQNLATGAGTDRSKAYSTSYVSVTEDMQQYLYAYEQEPLARRIVEQPAKDTFRKWRAWQADPVQIGLIEKLEKRLNVRAKLERAKIEANLRGKAYLYISIKNDDPNQPLNLERVRREMLDDVRVLTRHDVSEGLIDTDALSPTYGKPEYYEIATSKNFVRIHPSRMVVFLGAEKPYDFLSGEDGDSVLKATLPAIKRHRTMVDTVADMMEEAVVDVISVPGLFKLMQDPDEETAIINRFALMKQMKSNRRVTLLDAADTDQENSEEWTQKQISFATIPEVIKTDQIELCAVANIPRALMFGVSEGGLGSTGNLELTSYYDMINTIQTNDIEPAIYNLDECIIRSALGTRPDDVWYTWNSLWQVSDKERHENGAAIAKKWTDLINSGAIPAEAATMAVINDLTENNVGGGIEQVYNDWLVAGGMEDGDQGGESEID
jgi:phage-related protein (TIGR01555 family)